MNNAVLVGGILFNLRGLFQKVVNELRKNSRPPFLPLKRKSCVNAASRFLRYPLCKGANDRTWTRYQNDKNVQRGRRHQKQLHPWPIRDKVGPSSTKWRWWRQPIAVMASTAPSPLLVLSPQLLQGMVLASFSYSILPTQAKEHCVDDECTTSSRHSSPLNYPLQTGKWTLRWKSLSAFIEVRQGEKTVRADLGRVGSADNERALVGSQVASVKRHSGTVLGKAQRMRTIRDTSPQGSRSALLRATQPCLFIPALLALPLGITASQCTP